MSEKSQSFTSMAAEAAGEDIPEVGVGMLGYAFMGKAHSNAFRTIPYMMYPPPAIPRMVSVSGRSEAAVKAAAERFGYEKYTTDWREQINDPDVQLFDNGGPNDAHAEPCIAAAEAGKHILCEKPLGRTAEESKLMLDAVEKAGVKHMVAFNYRFVPAIRLVQPDRQRRTGPDLPFSGSVFTGMDYASFRHANDLAPGINSFAGSGAIGDLGAHIVDLGHYLIGDMKTISAMTETFIEERPLDGAEGVGVVDVDDAFVATVEFVNGAIGTLEATRFAGGRKNSNTFEINAEKGSIRFDLEKMNELEVFWVEDDSPDTQGFRTVLVSEPHHPWWENWWPAGHMIGWEHTFVDEISHLLDCIVNDKEVEPHGATFLDGYKASVVCDAIVESAETKRHIDVKY